MATKSNVQVSVIGLGAMGTALATTLISNGFSISVWNRTVSKAKMLISKGATFHEDISRVIRESEIIIVCIKDYETTERLLHSAEVAQHLAGKIIVQLTTGSPLDARNAQKWALARNAGYLDGAILATPSQIGRPETPIFLSGTKAIFDKAEPVLKTLAGNLMYKGEAVGNAAAWDLAILSGLFGLMTGFMHGAQIMQKENLRVDELGATINGIAPVLGEMVAETANEIENKIYDSREFNRHVRIEL